MVDPQLPDPFFCSVDVTQGHRQPPLKENDATSSSSRPPLNPDSMTEPKNPDLTLSEEMADLEKPDVETLRSPSTAELGIGHPVNALQRFCNRLDAVCGVEARGIERIPEELRERDMALKDYIHMFTMYVY